MRKRRVSDEERILEIPQEPLLLEPLATLEQLNDDLIENETEGGTPFESAVEELTDAHVTESPSTESQPSSSGEEKQTTDVNQCIEEIGFGRYQWKVILVMGMMSFADSCEIWLSSVIISMV